jgi:hypothetical protein
VSLARFSCQRFYAPSFGCRQHVIGGFRRCMGGFQHDLVVTVKSGLFPAIYEEVGVWLQGCVAHIRDKDIPTLNQD